MCVCQETLAALGKGNNDQGKQRNCAIGTVVVNMKVHEAKRVSGMYEVVWDKKTRRSKDGILLLRWSSRVVNILLAGGTLSWSRQKPVLA